MKINAYVIESENTGFYFMKKADSEKWLKEIREQGQKDIRYTFSEIAVNENDKNDYAILKDIEIFIN